ncbi:MAG: beta-glucosidase [Myxococcota bacterium]|nr:beta-glucosidase [Myxococcota bacterium]
MPSERRSNRGVATTEAAPLPLLTALAFGAENRWHGELRGEQAQLPSRVARDLCNVPNAMVVGMRAVAEVGRDAAGRDVKPLFESALLGGFECSCHRLESGVRLDLLSATRHGVFADADYARLRSVGIRGARDGVSWIEAAGANGSFDFSFVLPLLRAADRHGVRVVWDLMHFGWPDDINVFAPRFPSVFGAYARAFARWLALESDQPPIITPINEISYLAWAGGDVRCMNPFEAARGVELKVQLVRATIEAIEGIRSVFPSARFLQPEPVIHIVANPAHPKTWRRVESDSLLQYQAWDMLSGRVWPSLGGNESYLDIVGVNFYPDNQFTPEGETVRRGDLRYKAFSRMLLEVWDRYRRPMIVSETGSEGEDRAPWLRYVAAESEAALRLGCELHGITIYPIVNHPGWADARHCLNGLWDYANDAGEREADPALLNEILRQGGLLRDARQAAFAARGRASLRPMTDHRAPKT